MEPIWCYLMFGILGDRDLSARRGWRHHGTGSMWRATQRGYQQRGYQKMGKIVLDSAACQDA